VTTRLADLLIRIEAGRSFGAAARPAGDEVQLIRAVFDAFEVVVAQVAAQGGRLAPDAAYYDARGWAAVCDAARRALNRMNEVDT
jgi:hypothetical protein